MLGRFLALIGGAAMAALAVLLYDPTVYGPGAPSLSLGAYETFRALAIFCTAGLALCGLMGAFQPPAKSTKRVVASAPDGRGAHRTGTRRFPAGFVAGGEPALVIRPG